MLGLLISAVASMILLEDFRSVFLLKPKLNLMCCRINYLQSSECILQLEELSCFSYDLDSKPKLAHILSGLQSLCSAILQLLSLIIIAAVSKYYNTNEIVYNNCRAGLNG